MTHGSDGRSESNECDDIFRKYEAAEDKVKLDTEETIDLYRQADRHGFTHSGQSSVFDTREDDKAKERELKRERKWLKMLQRWKVYEGSAKLRRSIYKGIPQKFRAEVWRRLLNIDGQKMLGVYEKLCRKARHCAREAKQIDLDINRTYRNHILYVQRYGFKQKSLLNVLAAYSLFNVELGYCQGMNHLAALLLMYFVEEDAFWALHILMCDNRHAMHGFFVPGFPKLLRFQQHHDLVLKKQMPRLKAHLDSQGIHSGLYTTKWFFQCFLDRVPFSLALRLWDIFILEGDFLLTVTAYTMLKLHERQLLKFNFEQTMEFLQVAMERRFQFSNDQTVEALKKSIALLSRKGLLYAPPASRSETPSRPIGLMAFENGHDNICIENDASSTNFGYSSEENVSSRKTMHTLVDVVKDTQFARQTNGRRGFDSIPFHSSNVGGVQFNLGTFSKDDELPTLPDVNLSNRPLLHVPSFYDNLQDDFCCLGADRNGVGKCQRLSNAALNDSSYRIEVGCDLITRIHIDAP